MGHKYDEFYRLLIDSQVVQARAIREAEALGLSKALTKLKACHAETVGVANTVMTKIEAAHVADMLERQKLTDNLDGHDLYTTADADRPKAICDSNGEVVLGQCKKCGRGEIELTEPCVPRPATDSQTLDVPQLVDDLTAVGLNVMVIDENTHFSKLKLPDLN